MTAWEDIGGLTRLLERHERSRIEGLKTETTAIAGGLDSSGTYRMLARYYDGRGRQRVMRLVCKRVTGRAAREAQVYVELVARCAAGYAPRLLGVGHSDSGDTLLYLEHIRARQRWPWRDLSHSRQLLSAIARLHETSARTGLVERLPRWDYEQELEDHAAATVDLMARLQVDRELAPLGRGLASVRRVGAKVRAIRAQLLSFDRLGTVAVHGDVHPGNAIIRVTRRAHSVVLLDWARARAGAPLEDVNSWLWTLSRYEPEVLRHHDTLFCAYLGARGIRSTLGADWRNAYALAGGLNAFAGALLYHLLVASDRSRGQQERECSAVAALGWIRLVRRADAAWR